MDKVDSIECPSGPKDCPIFEDIKQLHATIAELDALVHADSLTGLFNKRHFALTLETELERCHRNHQPVSLIMLDIDHFKVVNDTYGHLAGDKVLQVFSSTIKKVLRKVDIPCRYGGEEFAIILPATPVLVAMQVAERLRRAIEESQAVFEGSAIVVTTSLGVSCYDFKHHKDAVIEGLTARADKQLYKAKNSGRNKVCAESLEPKKPSTVSHEEKVALFEVPQNDE